MSSCAWTSSSASSMGLPSGYSIGSRGAKCLWNSSDYYNYIRDMMSRFGRELEVRRIREIETNPERQSVPQDLEPLTVEVTEFYIRQNAAAHHTDAYELVCGVGGDCPILRRGSPFFFAVRFDRTPDPKMDAIRLLFSFGPNPSFARGTRALIPVGGVEQRTHLSGNTSIWEACVQKKDGKTIILEVQIPSSAPVGIWKCAIQSERRVQKVNREDEEGGIAAQLARREHKCDTDVFILFNPWCKEDSVYLENDSLRKEYVENDTGKVWLGCYKCPRGRPWIFGQYDDAVLPAVACLLELSRLNHADRGDPVEVSRAITAVVNSDVDDGLLELRCDGDYKNGTPPTAWTGSSAILEEYLRGGGRPVKYGQCWVFSAVTVTLCRALGIPCRSVTNFVSARDDARRSLSVERYFECTGFETKMDEKKEDGPSIWSFHSWNEVWMSRPDLPSGHDGWQAIDPTPHDHSHKMTACGPASLEAVRNGKLGFTHDTKFMFAQVNADLFHFHEDPESPWGYSRLRVDQYHTGKKIVTKRLDDDDLGDNDMEDITSLYKYPDAFAHDRLKKMLRESSFPLLQYHHKNNTCKEEGDVSFSFEDLDGIPYGDGFSVKVNIQNKANEKRKISAVLSVYSVFYTGTMAHRIKSSSVEFEMQPHSDETMLLRVSPKEYMGRLEEEHCLLKMHALARVEQTKQSWSDEDDIALRKPRLNIQVTGTMRVGSECCVTISFQNPLTENALTNCTLSLEGPGLYRPKIIRQRDFKPGELINLTERFFPRKSGKRRIVATFNSNQLIEIIGSTNVIISE